MDGFEVGRFEPGRVYSVAEPLGTYLVLAGYAVPVAVNTSSAGSEPVDRDSKS
jgi:hypothetical protein